MEFDDRYSRQVLFGPMGAGGQARLAAARVVMVGCGATGSTLASLLARAGVGTISIIDRDYVEPSNLQRQSLFDESDAAESIPKAIAAARTAIADASRFVSKNAVQLHGGMGVTDELIVSHYVKRLAMLNQTYGDYEHHLAQYVELMSA